jgi:hypothetical protein
MSMPSNEPVQDNVIDQGLGLMPQGQGDNSQPPQGQQQDQQPETNPMWKPLLDKLPSSLHGMITPELKQWDANYTQGMQKVHSEYAPYKSFLDNQVDPAELNDALMVYQSMQQDPAKFVQAVQDFYQLQAEQGQQQLADQQQSVDEEMPSFDPMQHPEIQKYAQMTETMAQAMLSQNEQAQIAQEDQQLEQEFQSAKQRHGEFDEEWVTKEMYFNEGLSLDDAVAKYREFTQGIVNNYQRPGAQAPTLMGGGGGLPSQQTAVGSMTGQQRRALIAQTLANAHANGG